MGERGYEFWRRAGRLINSGQARTVLLTGNIHDLFFQEPSGAGDDAGGDGRYVPLTELLAASWNLPDRILVVYELNGPLCFVREGDREKVKDAWLKWRTGLDSNELAIKQMLASARARAELDAMAEAFDANLRDIVGRPTLALELLRQMCLCSRTTVGDRPLLRENLIVIVEGADLLLPEAGAAQLSDADRHRVGTCQDWFSDPGFLNAGDAAVLLAESRSMLNSRVAALPQVLEVEVPSPDEERRRHFVSWFGRSCPEGRKPRLWGSEEELARLSAGLSIHALMQLLRGACHDERRLTAEDVVAKVEAHIQGQLGDDIVEFKKPTHGLDDVVGFSRLKRFLREELIPRFRSTGPDALPGAAVCGPIGGGKTFVFEAVAGELGMVVLVLKNIRSQWFGQTDVILERLKRVLGALNKVLILMDEADTQLGGVGPEVHDTERRLTGKIQAMMSDPAARGPVAWLLMTARIHLLSPDLRRPGRVGDLIIPVLDPEGEDRQDFLRWTLRKVLPEGPDPEQMRALETATAGYSAASFASLRSELLARAGGGGGRVGFERIMEVVSDHIPPAIAETRRYQTLQALVNCTRRSLLPDPKVGEQERLRWAAELRELEARGVR